MIIKLPLKGQFYYRYIHTFVRYEKEVETKKVKKGRKMNQQDQNDKKMNRLQMLPFLYAAWRKAFAERRY